MPTYAGGLGVLAGDLMRSAADLGVAMVGVTLASRHGYFRQQITPDGNQIESPEEWDPAAFAAPLGTAVTIRLNGHDVWIHGWLYVESGLGGSVPVVLLDSMDARNTSEDRTLTDVLYGGDESYRLKQEAILGIGGVRMLRALGFRIREYHMNEGHSALLALELLREQTALGSNVDRALEEVRLRINFTTHTPVEAAHDHFSYELVRAVFGDTVDQPLLRRIGGNDELNLTGLARATSGVVNGVATKERMPHAKEIANGVHSVFWTFPSFAHLYDRYIPEWRHEPALLTRAMRIPGEEILQAHGEAKRALIDTVRARTGTVLDSSIPIIGFARRMTGYKRPDLLFQDLGALRQIAREHRFQIVLAGKAHPHDEEGKRAIHSLHEYANQLGGDIPTVFLPQYDLDLAKVLTAGSDVWLNTPLPPMEASGTSGMKAAHNGVPSLSVLDGWWIQGWIEGVTGWAIDEEGSGNHRDRLYRKLREVILPLYFSDRQGWVEVMKGTIVHNASLFNSHRTLRRYAAEVYLAAS